MIRLVVGQIELYCIHCCHRGALHTNLVLPELVRSLVVQVEGVTEVQQLRREVQQLIQLQRQLVQVVLNQVAAVSKSGSSMVIAHHMGQMRDVQVGMTGMMMEMYRILMQSGHTVGLVGCMPVPSEAVANVNEQGLPKAVQARLRKEHKLREKQHQQQVEKVTAKKQALKDQMPGHHSSTESAAEAAEKAPCLSTDAAHAATPANMQSVSTSDAAEPMCLEQAAPCHEILIPGKGRLAWTEWLGKRVGISG